MNGYSVVSLFRLRSVYI